MKSKILTYLKVPEVVSDGFTNDVKQLVQLLDGTQEIYAESTDEKKKAQLAKGIVSMMRILMEYLRGKNLGVYGNMNVKLEQKSLPQVKQDDLPPTPKMPKPQPPTPPTPPAPKPEPPKPQPPAPEPPTPQPPKPEPPQPEPPKKRGRKPKQTEPPTPPAPPKEDVPEYTKEELEELIDFTQILADEGDEEAISELITLKQIQKRYFS